MKQIYLIVYRGGTSALIRASSSAQAEAYSKLLFSDIPATGATVASQERVAYSERMCEKIYEACIQGAKSE
jgi:hypothetical protein